MLDTLTLSDLFLTILGTSRDVIPIILILLGFQFLVIRRRVTNLKRIIIGFIYVLIGLSLFLLGLEKALFPLGKVMAEQLTDPVFIIGSQATDATRLH